MNLDQAIAGRRSIREYTATTADEGVIYRLINAAVQAPKRCQPATMAVAVVRDQALLDRISSEAKAYMLARKPAGQHSDYFHLVLTDVSGQMF